MFVLTVAASVAAGTIGTSTWLSLLEVIPEVVCLLVAIIGGVLSLVLTYNHFRNGRATHIKLMLEIAALRRKETDYDDSK